MEGLISNNVSSATLSGLILTAGAATVAAVVYGMKKLDVYAKQWHSNSTLEWKAILRNHQIFIAETLPPQLTLRATLPLDASVPSALDVEVMLNVRYWTSLTVVEGMWYEVAMDAVRQICQFVNESRTRENLFQDKYSLPRHFFLAEMLTWLVHDLGTYRGNDPEVELDILERRMNYVDALEMGDQMKNGPRWFVWEQHVSMRKVLCQLSGLLRWTVVPELRLIQERQSAAKRVENLRISMRAKVLGGLLQYLYRVASETEPAHEFVVSEFQNHAESRFDNYKTTTCGQLMAVLLQCKSVGSLYQQRQRDQLPCCAEAENPFFAGNPLTAALPGALFDDHQTRIGSKNIVEHFRKAKSGVFRDLLDDGAFLYLLTRLYGLTAECGGFLYFLQRLNEICDAGGSVLVYGIMSRRVVELLESLVSLLQGVAHSVELMELRTRKVYEDRISKDQPPTKWENNYRASGARPLLRTLAKAIRQAVQIREECESMSLSERAKQLQQDVDKFWFESSSQLDRMVRLGVTKQRIGDDPGLALEGLRVAPPVGKQPPQFTVYHDVQHMPQTGLQQEASIQNSNLPLPAAKAVTPTPSVWTKTYHCSRCKGVDTNVTKRSRLRKAGYCSTCNGYTVQKVYQCRLVGHVEIGTLGKHAPKNCSQCSMSEPATTNTMASSSGFGGLARLIRKTRAPSVERICDEAEEVQETQQQQRQSIDQRLRQLPVERRTLLISSIAVEDDGASWVSSALLDRMRAEKRTSEITPMILGQMEGSTKIGRPFNFILVKNAAIPLSVVRGMLEGQRDGKWRLDGLQLLFETDTGAGIGDAVCSLLRTDCWHLRSLALVCQGVSDYGACDLGAVLATHPTLQTVDLSENPELTIAGLTALCTALSQRSADTLFDLNLSHCALSEQSCEVLLAMWESKPLWFLNMRDNLREDGGSMTEVQARRAHAFRSRCKTMQAELDKEEDSSVADDKSI